MSCNGKDGNYNVSWFLLLLFLFFRVVFVVALAYLSCVHLHRIYYDYGSPTIDITAPLMIITQKVTTLAFSIHDGMSRPDDELNASQRFHAVRKLPSLLEYFAYCLHFQSLLAGPIVLYKDYVEFIEGHNILRHAPSTNVSALFFFCIRSKLFETNVNQKIFTVCPPSSTGQLLKRPRRHPDSGGAVANAHRRREGDRQFRVCLHLHEVRHCVSDQKP